MSELLQCINKEQRYCEVSQKFQHGVANDIRIAVIYTIEQVIVWYYKSTNKGSQSCCSPYTAEQSHCIVQTEVPTRYDKNRSKGNRKQLIDTV